MSVAAEMLAELTAAIAACRLCALAAGRSRTVPGEGPASAAVMVVGEGPGEQEDRTGRPFVGAAGELLNQLLAHAGLDRDEVFIANVVKCRPPRNREPLPEEARACRPYLDAQIALVNPRVICLLGRPATQALLSPQVSISRVHGQPVTKDGMVCLPLFHPAAALHRPDLRPALFADMERLRSLLQRLGVR